MSLALLLPIEFSQKSTGSISPVAGFKSEIKGVSGRRRYDGTVTWISDKAEFTPKTIQTRDERANLVYAVKIAVKNDGYIKRGMYGEIKINK